MNYKIEKNKLYKYLGESLVNRLKLYKAFVAGGTITSLFCNRDINDIDIYFRSKEDAADFVSGIIEDREWVICYTNKAILFKYQNKTLCQAIYFNYFDSAEKIFDTFDFTVCMGAFDFEKEEFVLHEEFIKHNAQRILKFNENTAFPIISVLRIQKYRDKGYNISKSEYIKIILSCIILNINNYEELKEQTSGMYGESYDKVLKPQEGEEFNLKTIISKIDELAIADDCFSGLPTNRKTIEDIDNFIYEIFKIKIKVVKVKNNFYKYMYDDFKYISQENFDKNKEIYELVDLKEIIPYGTKFYKFVRKENNTYSSFYDYKFKYIIGEEISVDLKQDSSGIYCNLLEHINNSTYQNEKNKVVVELELLDYDDIIDLDIFRLKRAKVSREVSEEEYEKYLRR
jgi:hypothetical protein